MVSTEEQIRAFCIFQPSSSRRWAPTLTCCPSCKRGLSPPLRRSCFEGVTVNLSPLGGRDSCLPRGSLHIKWFLLRAVQNNYFRPAKLHSSVPRISHCNEPHPESRFSPRFPPTSPRRLLYCSRSRPPRGGVSPSAFKWAGVWLAADARRFGRGTPSWRVCSKVR